MFGSHLSISGGMHNALVKAGELKFDTVQVFTKNQQQWKCAPLAAEAIETWDQHRRQMKFEHTVSHDSYLINLASPDAVLREKSIALFVEELLRCEALNIPYLVTHPGAHMGQGEEKGLELVAQALDEVHARVPTKKKPKSTRAAANGNFAGVITCLEITAGQGTSLGYRLEHLARIIELVRQPERLGICLDTAHLFAAGYDFRGRKYTGFTKQVDAIVGISRVKVLHLNDSKKELGSRVDRHAHIGLGFIGDSGFEPIVRDKNFANIPKILETPKEKDEAGREWDEVNLERLRSMMR